MKRFFVISVLAFLFVGNVCAQQGQRSEEEP